MEVEIKILSNSRYSLPEYAHVTDSGMDVKANIDERVVLKPLERYLFPTGIYVELPPNYEIQVRPRSGLAIKRGLVPVFGTVDEGYRGEIGVTVINLSNEEQVIDPGERIAQFVIAKVEKATLKVVDKISENTDRGKTGYGESGRF